MHEKHSHHSHNPHPHHLPSISGHRLLAHLEHPILDSTITHIGDPAKPLNPPTLPPRVLDEPIAINVIASSTAWFSWKIVGALLHR
jgi:hypothetical protein